MATDQHKIYKLYDQRGQVYFGSTRQRDLRLRLNQHRCGAKRETSTSYLLFLPTCDGDESIVTIEELERLPPGTCEAGVRERERWYVEGHECVNKNIPGRSAEESAKAYRAKNRPKCRDACRRWREKHPSYPKEWREKHPTYHKDHYQLKKAQRAFVLKQELSKSECEALDAEEASDATSTSEDGDMELVYDANAWFDDICDKGFTVSFE
jgi:hypothetical protein